MKTFGAHNYYVYILANVNKTVLYIGVTNNLQRRLFEHKADANGEKKHFAGKYNCIHLLYYENFQDVNIAIAREKQLKGWTRAKKNSLISNNNTNLEFLNYEFEE